MTARTDADDATPLAQALWDAMLALRATGAPAVSGADALGHTEGLGWHPHARFSDAEQTGFTLYKPLLDAATAAPTGRPWLLAQLGQSLDGCIATRSAASNFVTGEASLVHLHRLRALCDAVLVGAGTVAADNPRLTTRRVSGPATRPA